ncbi:MAG: IS1595 family transposase, partial [Terracidiphilus sp.]
PLHLKETEFRFNHRNDDIYKLLLSILRKDPL